MTTETTRQWTKEDIVNQLRSETEQHMLQDHKIKVARRFIRGCDRCQTLYQAAKAVMY